jgi:Carboxypeptidase regulatory-like domain/TonB dependent receptor
MRIGRHTLLCVALLVVVVAILMPSSAKGQTAGEITGQVLDNSKASIAGATVTAKNVGTGETRAVQTDSQGHYRITELRIGTYDISAEHQGFRREVKTGVLLNVAATVELNFTIQVGSVNEEIVVTSDAPILEKGDASTGTTMQTQQIDELPINGRDYARFALLTPGAVLRSNFIADLSFNGLHTVHNQFSIDGVDASRVDQPYMANGFERGARLLTGSLDTISEFKVQTSDYGAEYGRAGGSYVNIVTKSGTNEIHGSAFEYFRNDILDAENFFAVKTAPKPEFRYNNFGGNFGGPIRKNSTFVFLNYEGSRQRIGITGSGTVPSDALRAQVLATSPQLKDIVGLFPLGTSPTSDPLVDNFTTTSASAIREDTGSLRLDHKFSGSDSAFVRLNINDSFTHGALFGVFPNSLGPNDHQIVPLRTTNIAIHETHFFNSSFINDFLAGLQRWASNIDSREPFPATTVVGLTANPGTQSYFLENNNSFQYGDNMSLVKGRHALKWGANMYKIQVNANSADFPTMQFNSITDFINDSVAQVNISAATPGNGTRATQIGAFVQDSYQIRPNLTIDYGLRYDIETVPHDSKNATRPFDTRCMCLAPAGTPYFQINSKDFGPRVGIAWSPTQHIVVRSGYGIYFQDYPVGFGSYYVPSNTITGNVTLLQSQIPTLTYPYTPFLSQTAVFPPNVNGFPWHKPDIYVNQYNLSVAAQISNDWAIQVAYLGNHGVNLWREFNINYINPATNARPLPQFGNVLLQSNSGFNSYNGMQVSIKRRMQKGFTFDLEYSLGHGIDDVDDQGLFASDPQDTNNFKAERGNGSGDIRHNVSFNTMYELPFGHQHRFLGTSSSTVDRIVGGWSVAALGILRTGVASTVHIGTNTFGNGDFTNQRPNRVPGVSQYGTGSGPDNFLNGAAYSMPAPGTFGNLGRDTFYGPSYKQIDFSILKKTRVTESKNFEFRAEMFNLFNHPNFDEPNGFWGVDGSGKVFSSFGQIFNTLGRTLGVGTSRQIQLALRFNF